MKRINQQIIAQYYNYIIIYNFCFNKYRFVLNKICAEKRYLGIHNNIMLKCTPGACKAHQETHEQTFATRPAQRPSSSLDLSVS